MKFAVDYIRKDTGREDRTHIEANSINHACLLADKKFGDRVTNVEII